MRAAAVFFLRSSFLIALPPLSTCEIVLVPRGGRRLRRPPPKLRVRELPAVNRRREREVSELRDRILIEIVCL